MSKINELCYGCGKEIKGFTDPAAGCFNPRIWSQSGRSGKARVLVGVVDVVPASAGTKAIYRCTDCHFKKYPKAADGPKSIPPLQFTYESADFNHLTGVLRLGVAKIVNGVGEVQYIEMDAKTLIKSIGAFINIGAIEAEVQFACADPE